MNTINQMTTKNLTIKKWLNTDKHFSTENLSGKITVIYAFQMLCPGCVSNSIPQAKKVHVLFADKEVSVIGLHTVFEHHQAMTEVSLKAFMHEYKIEFPVAIDMPSENAQETMPESMKHFQMRGTPTLLIFDKKGQLRNHIFGHVEDLIVGAEIMALIKEG